MFMFNYLVNMIIIEFCLLQLNLSTLHKNYKYLESFIIVLKVKEIVKELKIFERNKVSLEIKVLGIATYIQTSSVRRIAGILSELHPVSKTLVWKIKKFEEKLPITAEKKERNLIAIDETIVKARKKKYYVYSAVNVEKNELILMRVYATKNYLTTKSFVKEVLEYCKNKPKFIVDKAPWLIDALKSLGLEFEHQSFRWEKFSWISVFFAKAEDKDILLLN